MSGALVADTGGLLRALACGPDGMPQWPEFAEALTGEQGGRKVSRLEVVPCRRGLVPRRVTAPNAAI